MRRSPLVTALAAVVLLAACGTDDAEDGADVATTTPELSLVPATPPPAPPVPSVILPDEAPDELTVTTLIEGRGRQAVEGDSVLVRYVGVRFETGDTFDENFSGGDPFPVTLGAGGVIAGWDEGLLGVRAGEQRQLDIPADLGYGPTPTTTPGATTEPGGSPTGPLSFLVEALAVIGPADPEREPTTEDVPVSDELTTEVIVEDVNEGDGATVDRGMVALVHFALARRDNGVILRSTWDQGAPSQLVLAPSGQMDGLVDGLVGMRVGGRRIITVPYELAFGEEGFPQAGLPARTDAVVIVDLVGAY